MCDAVEAPPESHHLAMIFRVITIVPIPTRSNLSDFQANRGGAGGKVLSVTMAVLYRATTARATAARAIADVSTAAV